MAGTALRILLVEADDEYAATLTAALASAAPEAALDRVSSLRAARARLADSAIDAVLLGLELPDGSGFDVIDRIRQQAPVTPVVVVLGADDPAAASAAVQRGAEDCLTRSEAEGRLAIRALRYAVERARARSALAAREPCFRALIEQAYDIVVVLAADGRFIYQSPATRRVLGYPPEELDGTNVLELIHPDDRPRAAAILAAGLADLPPDEQYLFRVRHRDGGWRVLEALGRPLEEDPGQGIVVNARDVTERVRAEERLLEAQAKLRQAHKMEAVGRLAGGIAHDFNNVLTTIYGYADLLIEEFDPSDPRREDVAEIRRSAERAATLTRQLLAFSRQQVLQPQVLDLNTVVEDLRRMMARLVGSDIVVTFEPAAGLWPVRADRGQIEQVLLNLAGNARDAMPDGGSLSIRTGNARLSREAAEARPGLEPGDYVTLAVSDTGVGMSEPVRQHVFEPFFTTKDQGQGTGLGLATVYGIVKQSGGGIYVDSEEHEGTTFTIYLPPHAASPSP